MSSDVLLEEFEVRLIIDKIVRGHRFRCPHLGLGIYLPGRTHKFVFSLIQFNGLGHLNRLIFVLIRNI